MGSIDLDFRTQIPPLKGMKKDKSVLLERPGVFTLQVPKNTGSVGSSAFKMFWVMVPLFDDPFCTNYL